MHALLRRVATLVALCATAGAASTQTIDTRSGPLIGVAPSTDFGQVFTAPAGVNALTSFTFFMATNAAQPTDPVARYRATIMAWDGQRPVGPVLFQTPERDAVACCVIQLPTVPIDALVPVVPGSMYVAFVTMTSGSLVVGFPTVGGEAADTYAGGHYAFTPCPASPLSCNWGRTNTVPNRDMAFVATFASAETVVPEPATFALCGGGLLALLAFGRVRRRVGVAPPLQE